MEVFFMKEYNTLDDFDVENKTVLLRVDFNMPLDKDTLDILDTTRIKLVLPTIKELIEKNVKIVILAHQGRQGSWDFTSLEKHAKALQELIGKEVHFVDDIFRCKLLDIGQQVFLFFLDGVEKKVCDCAQNQRQKCGFKCHGQATGNQAEIFLYAGKTNFADSF